MAWRKCEVIGCYNSKKINPDLVFYKLPSIASIRKKWLEACGLRAEPKKKHNFICSVHFEPSCFNEFQTTLKICSIPTLFVSNSFSYHNINLETKLLKVYTNKKNKCTDSEGLKILNGESDVSTFNHHSSDHAYSTIHQNKEWTYNQTKALIACYCCRQEEYEKVRQKKIFWKNIIQDLKRMNVLKFDLSVHQVNRRWKFLVNKYKYVKARGYGKFKFMKDLDQLFVKSKECSFKARSLDEDDNIDEIEENKALHSNNFEIRISDEQKHICEPLLESNILDVAAFNTQFDQTNDLHINSKSCLICLKKEGNISIHKQETSTGKLVDKIESFADLTVSIDSGLPSYVCIKCAFQVNAAFKFKKQCIESLKTRTDLLSHKKSEHSLIDNNDTNVKQSKNLKKTLNVSKITDPDLSHENLTQEIQISITKGIIIDDLIEDPMPEDIIKEPIPEHSIGDSLFENIIEEPLSEDITKEQLSEYTMEDPLSENITKESLDDIVEDPLSDNIITESLDDIVEDPLSDNIITEPLSEYIIKDLIMENIKEEPIFDDIIEDPLSEDIIKHPLSEYFIEVPLTEDIKEELIFVDIVEDPLSDAIIKEPLYEYIIEDPLSENIKEELISNDITENSLSEDIREELLSAENLNTATQEHILMKIKSNTVILDNKFCSVLLSDIMKNKKDKIQEFDNVVGNLELIVPNILKEEPNEKKISKKMHNLHNMRIYNRNNICNICGKSFKKQTSLLKHKTFHIKKFQQKPGLHYYVYSQCNECDKKFKSRSSFMKHKKIFHKNIINYKCVVCEMEFYNLFNYQQHIRRHTGENPFECKLCDQVFGKRSYLKTHLNKVHDVKTPSRITFIQSKTNKNNSDILKNYKCEVCGKTFLKSGDLQRHTLNVHSEKVKCEICNKLLKKKSIKDHTMSQHSIVYKETTRQCSECKLFFKSFTDLQSHMIVHSGEKIFELPSVIKKLLLKKTMMSDSVELNV